MTVREVQVWFQNRRAKMKKIQNLNNSKYQQHYKNKMNNDGNSMLMYSSSNNTQINSPQSTKREMSGKSFYVKNDIHKMQYHDPEQQKNTNDYYYHDNLPNFTHIDSGWLNTAKEQFGNVENTKNSNTEMRNNNSFP